MYVQSNDRVSRLRSTTDIPLLKLSFLNCGQSSGVDILVLHEAKLINTLMMKALMIIFILFYLLQNFHSIFYVGYSLLYYTINCFNLHFNILNSLIDIHNSKQFFYAHCQLSSPFCLLPYLFIKNLPFFHINMPGGVFIRIGTMSYHNYSSVLFTELMEVAYYLCCIFRIKITCWFISQND